MDSLRCDIAVVGAGAAGLMAAIAAARALSQQSAPAHEAFPRVIALDSAQKLGAKILVSGGGRCNVTHHEVSASDYAGSTPQAIRNVLAGFSVQQTIDFFADLGITLKREETGKLFPTTDNARTVLDALLTATRDAGVTLLYPWRVESIRVLESAAQQADIQALAAHKPPDSSPCTPPRFELISAAPPPNSPRSILASRVILATGGKSLPKTGSDGHGYTLARSLGHTITPPDAEGGPFPALAPLTLPKNHWATALSGLAARASVAVHSATGKRLFTTTNSVLLTHFGLTGPAILDASRHLAAACASDPNARLVLSWLPDLSTESADAALQTLAKQPAGRAPLARWLMSQGIPERLARALLAHARLEDSAAAHSLTRDSRRALAATLTACDMPITGSRGFLFAEVTAGGVPLREVKLSTMESRACEGLHLCGELLDVDGRLGGFNFQWAWSSAHLAGTQAARALLQS